MTNGIAQDPANPWTMLRTTTAYENPWIRVDHHDVLDPAGKPGIYGIVHYKNSTVATLAIDQCGRVCLVGQYRLPHKEIAWELPGGFASRGNDVKQAANRELQEEAGFEANEWIALPPLHTSNGITDEVAFPFVAWTLRTCDAKPETTECLNIRLVPFWEAVTRVEQGELRDAITVAALLRVALMALRSELPQRIARLIEKS